MSKLFVVKLGPGQLLAKWSVQLIMKLEFINTTGAKFTSLANLALLVDNLPPLSVIETKSVDENLPMPSLIETKQRESALPPQS